MPPHLPKTSQTLQELHDSFADDEPILLKEVLKRLDGRAFGILLFALAVPNCIPNIPGISTIFGALLIAPALQMIFGAGQVWLPRQVREMQIQPISLRTGIEKSIPILQKMEKLFQPRLEFLTTKPFTIILGIEVFILSLILLLPIPFANMLPGFAIAFMALGLLQKDGLLIILSNLLFLISLIIAPIGIGAGLAALHFIVTTIRDFALHLFGG